jgi:hypothetical protein
MGFPPDIPQALPPEKPGPEISPENHTTSIEELRARAKAKANLDPENDREWDFDISSTKPLERKESDEHSK